MERSLMHKVLVQIAAAVHLGWLIKELESIAWKEDEPAG